MEIAVYNRQQVQFESTGSYINRRDGQRVRVFRVCFPDGSEKEMTEGEFSKKRLAIVKPRDMDAHCCRRRRITSAVQVSPTRVQVQIQTDHYDGRIETETEIYPGCAVLPYSPPVKASLRA